MFIVSITYSVDLDVVDKFLDQHKTFLQEYREKGVFLASGRKNPRTGGVIFAQSKNRGELLKILKRDPFYWNNIGEYLITEFEPTMVADGITLVSNSCMNAN